MTTEIGGYEFEGPHTNCSELKERNGIYLVTCLVDGEPHCLLDIGTSTEIKNRLHCDHDRRDCWEDNAHGEIGYYVMYTSGMTGVTPNKYISPTVQNSKESTQSQRFIIEDELKWKFDVPCGTNQWKQKEEAIARYNTHEELFGPRGHHELS